MNSCVLLLRTGAVRMEPPTPPVKIAFKLPFTAFTATSVAVKPGSKQIVLQLFAGYIDLLEQTLE